MSMPKRILVIDDEELVREVIRSCLEDVGGWLVDLASSGQEALVWLQRSAIKALPDAILLDVSMPGMDGVETFRRLQSDPQTQKIPVIFLTAKIQPADKAQFTALGIAGLLAKPFDPMLLTEEVANILKWEIS
jgi:CheY-like chemotaxis protein